MAVPPINRAEVRRIAKQIAHSQNKKATTVELLGNPGSEKRNNLDPAFVKAVKIQVKKIIRKETGQPTLHPIKDWNFVQTIREIQARIEKPSEFSMEAADNALEREVGQMHLEDYIDVCRSAQTLLQMYEHALPPETKGERNPKNLLCSEGTKRFFYKKLKDRHDEISYLELDVDAIATKSALAIFMLTENEDFMPHSLHLPDLDLNNVINVFSELDYSKKRDLVLAYFMNPGTSGSELYPLMKSLFAISNGLDEEVKIEGVSDNTENKNAETQIKPPINQESLYKQLAEEVNNITQYAGRLLYTQATTFPDEVDTNTIDFDRDDDNDFGGIGLIDRGEKPQVSSYYTKQYVLHGQEILIQGLEEHIFDLSFDEKLNLFSKLSGDEHRLRLACVLTNDVENDTEAAKVEALFLNEINDGSLSDSTGYRASKGVEFYANLKREDSVARLVEFLDHEDQMVRYEAFKKLSDKDTTGNPGENALVDKIENDIKNGNPSWAFALLCRLSSSQYGLEFGNEDKYRAILLRVLMLKDIDTKNTFKKFEGLEVPFTLNLGEPSPGDTEPLTIYEVIDYIGIPELMDITIHGSQEIIRENARKILEVLIEENPLALDDAMKTHEIADSFRRAAGIAHASSDAQMRKKKNS